MANVENKGLVQIHTLEEFILLFRAFVLSHNFLSTCHTGETLRSCIISGLPHNTARDGCTLIILICQMREKPVLKKTKSSVQAIIRVEQGFNPGLCDSIPLALHIVRMNDSPNSHPCQDPHPVPCNSEVPPTKGPLDWGQPCDLIWPLWHGQIRPKHGPGICCTVPWPSWNSVVTKNEMCLSRPADPKRKVRDTWNRVTPANLQTCEQMLSVLHKPLSFWGCLLHSNNGNKSSLLSLEYHRFSSQLRRKFCPFNSVLATNI